MSPHSPSPAVTTQSLMSTQGKSISSGCPVSASLPYTGGQQLSSHVVPESDCWSLECRVLGDFHCKIKLIKHVNLRKNFTGEMKLTELLNILYPPKHTPCLVMMGLENRKYNKKILFISETNHTTVKNYVKHFSIILQVMICLHHIEKLVLSQSIQSSSIKDEGFCLKLICCFILLKYFNATKVN